MKWIEKSLSYVLIKVFFQQIYIFIQKLVSIYYSVGFSVFVTICPNYWLLLESYSVYDILLNLIISVIFIEY